MKEGQVAMWTLTIFPAPAGWIGLDWGWDGYVMGLKSNMKINLVCG